MNPEEQRRLTEQLNGVCIAVEAGFREVRKDIGYLSRIYIPLTALAIIAGVLAALSTMIALDNRAMILDMIQNQRQLEQKTEQLELEQ